MEPGSSKFTLDEITISRKNAAASSQWHGLPHQVPLLQFPHKSTGDLAGCLVVSSLLALVGNAAKLRYQTPQLSLPFPI
ncbi:hypothetical protein NPIL_435491 [Nephila pilipes]|uniref:Uncharacterized protein n=1 Tax=Nephila pilipes TaxID=299642 RepID=A0A8X6UTL9_NEPPI|nr:hypothetical protein NPIL_435491 [Nephila pilipes]